MDAGEDGTLGRFTASADAVAKVRPLVRKFHS